MKHTFIAIFVILCGLYGCKDTDDLQSSGHLRMITASIGGSSDTRIGLTPDVSSKDIITRWQADDKVRVIITHDTKTYDIGDVSVYDISSDGKSCTFQYLLPEELEDVAEGYRLSCFTNNCNGKVQGGDVLYNASIERAPISQFKARVMFDEHVDEANSFVTFNHYGTYELLHIANKSDKSISFSLNGFDASPRWYREHGAMSLYKNNQFVSDTSFDSVEQSQKVTIPANETDIVVSWYIPNGQTISNATMVAMIDDKEVRSSNTISSEVTLCTGIAYHMYATWDGTKLTFDKSTFDVATMPMAYLTEYSYYPERFVANLDNYQAIGVWLDYCGMYTEKEVDGVKYHYPSVEEWTGIFPIESGLISFTEATTSNDVEEVVEIAGQVGTFLADYRSNGDNVAYGLKLQSSNKRGTGVAYRYAVVKNPDSDGNMMVVTSRMVENSSIGEIANEFFWDSNKDNDVERIFPFFGYTWASGSSYYQHEIGSLGCYATSESPSNGKCMHVGNGSTWMGYRHIGPESTVIRYMAGEMPLPLQLSNESLDLKVGGSGMVEILTPGGKYVASSDDRNVAVASVTDNTVTVTASNVGETVISVVDVYTCRTAKLRVSVSQGDLGNMPTDGLVAYYPFNGNANDLSGNGNHGVPTENVVLATGVNGDENGAYLFGGYYKPGHIYIRNSESLKFVDGATFSVFVKPTSWYAMDGGKSRSYGGTQCFISKNHDSGSISFVLNGSDEQLNVGVASSSEKWGIVSSSDKLKGNYLNKWTHIAFVYGNGRACLYVDGILIDSKESTPDFSNINERDLYIGKFYDKWYPFDGLIDEVCIYNRALSTSEIGMLVKHKGIGGGDKPDVPVSAGDDEGM